MNRQNALTLLTLSLLIGGTAHAADQLALVPPSTASFAEEETLQGEIRSVDAENGSFTLVDGDQVHAVKLGEKTEITLDGEESSAKEALKRGRSVKVVMEDGVVTSIAVTTEA